MSKRLRKRTRRLKHSRRLKQSRRRTRIQRERWLIEARGAVTAVQRLMQLLEENLIQFSCRVLEIEEEKARAFLTEANKVVNRLNKFEILKDVPHSYVVVVEKGLQSLALKINEDLMDATRSPEVLLDSPWIVFKIQDIMCELENMKSSLEAFVHKLDGEVSSHPVATLLEQLQLANDLLASNEEFRKVIGFFNGVVTEAEFPYDKARRLLLELKDSSHDVVNHIKTAAERAGDSIEEFFTMAGDQFWWQKKDFMDDNIIPDLLKHIDQLLEGVPGSTQGGNEEDNASTSIDSQGKRSPSPQIQPEPFGRGCRRRRLRRRLRWRILVGRSLLPRSQDNFSMVLDDGISNMMDELTGPPSGLTIVKISQGVGTGKTSPMEKVFRHPNVVNHFDRRAWVNDISSTDQVLLSRILHSIAPTTDEIHGQSVEDEGKLLYNSLRGRKYLIILDGLQNFEVWDALQRYFPDDKVGSRIVLSGVLQVPSSWESSLKQEDNVVGLNEHISEIIDDLTRPPSGLSIVTIAGMGGIGKTTLAKKVFHHPTIVHHFHLLAWVNSVSSADQVLSHLFRNIASSPEEFQGQSRQDKGELLYRNLKGRRYLIVADGLWNFKAWDDVLIYFPDDKVGSRILITTRDTEFPSSTNIPKNPPRCMTPLDKHQSWELLEKLVFGKESCPSELFPYAKQVAERCGGLPLAIVIIAGILQSNRISLSSCLSVMADVTSVVSADPERCLDILAVSYNRLPHHLKACFLYMGAFPANCEIGVKYLLNLWIANGFLDSESSEDSEIEAEKYLKNLIARSLVSVGKRSLDGKPRTCLIHDLVRQLCLREAQNENFMHVVEAGVDAQDLEKQRHLIFNLDNLDAFQLLPPLPHLRSFIWMNLGSDFTPGTVLLQLSVFKGLQVLDIYFLPFDTFPLQLLNLVDLRYLGLMVTYELDASISQLSKLQTLVIYGPWLLGEGEGNPTLFLEFWKMPFLRNVYLKVPSCLRYPYILQPSDVPLAPSNLRSFSMITFSSCTEEVFSLMPNLKKLGVSETKEDFENGESAECFQIFSFLTELEKLKCSFYKGNEEARTFCWDVLPVNLKRLTLKGSRLSWDKMKFIAMLPNLVSLKLKNYAFQGPDWVLTEEEVFCCLKQLLIDNTDLVRWDAESTNNFPCLQRLVLRSCMSLETFPCEELAALEVIELHNCSELAENSAKDFKASYGYPEVIVSNKIRREMEKVGQSTEYMD